MVDDVNEGKEKNDQLAPPVKKKGFRPVGILVAIIVLLVIALVFFATPLKEMVLPSKTAPALTLELVDEPEITAEGAYRFLIKALVQGNPKPTVIFNRDDSTGEAGENQIWIVLQPGENFTLMATAINEKGYVEDSLEIAAPASENEEPEPEPGTGPQPEPGTGPEPPASAANNAPVIAAINLSSEVIITGWTYTVTADCSDPDGDTLTFEWSASGGSITDATVNPMTWKAPNTKGEYSITVTVRDGRGGVATRSQEVSANPLVLIPTYPLTELKSITLQPASTGQVDSKGHLAIPSNAGDTDAKWGLQGFITFDLSSIPDSATIKSARLEVVSYDTLGDPFGSLGPLRAYVHNYGTLDAADYTPPPVSGAIVRFSNEAELNNATVQELNSIGITGIQDALSSDKFQIRLQFNDKETDNDSVTDVLRGNFRLVIKYTS